MTFASTSLTPGFRPKLIKTIFFKPQKFNFFFSFVFTGDLCQTELNECGSSPCLNGATCTDLIGLFQCICVAGYEGERCELETNECDSSPCVNAGKICITC